MTSGRTIVFALPHIDGWQKKRGAVLRPRPLYAKSRVGLFGRSFFSHRIGSAINGSSCVVSNNFSAFNGGVNFSSHCVSVGSFISHGFFGGSFFSSFRASSQGQSSASNSSDENDLAHE